MFFSDPRSKACESITMFAPLTRCGNRGPCNFGVKRREGGSVCCREIGGEGEGGKEGGGRGGKLLHSGRPCCWKVNTFSAQLPSAIGSNSPCDRLFTFPVEPAFMSISPLMAFLSKRGAFGLGALDFLREPRNQRLLGWLGGGVVVIIVVSGRL